MIYDTAIIGTGPAGISAAINLKILNKNFIWLGSKNFSDKVEKAEKIANYPGFINTSGEELNKAFKAQIEAMDIEIHEQMVNAIMKMGANYALAAGSDFYQAKSIIITTGVTNTGVLINETNLVGKGVSYCATCDGALYKDKTISVICAVERFEHEVIYLANLAQKVYLFPMYKNIGDLPDNVEIMREKPKAVIGDNRVSAIELVNGKMIDVDGLFCLRNSVSLSTLIPKLECVNGRIIVDREMKTNLEGVFAAGDCTGRPYQYAKAVGEGNVAAHSVVDYLFQIESNEQK